MTMARKAGVAAALIGSIAILPTTSARAESPFATLAGTWSGSGKVKLEGGKTEAIRCRAYYTPKSDGAGLGMAIRCASASNKIEMRADLTYTNGAVSGSWEERTYNATGQVSGRASADRLNLAIDGGGLNGSMQVKLGGSSQSVSISTKGSTFQGLDLSLSRS